MGQNHESILEDRRVYRCCICSVLVNGAVPGPSPQGVRYARTDLGGAYRWSETDQTSFPDVTERQQQNAQPAPSGAKHLGSE